MFKFVNKENLEENLEDDFGEIFDAGQMEDIYNVEEHGHHSLEATEVRLGSDGGVYNSDLEEEAREVGMYISLDQCGACWSV